MRVAAAPLSVQDRERRVVTGPEAVKQMFAQHELQGRRDEWPYPWLMPSRAAEPVFRVGSVLAPAFGAETEVLLYSVPAGLQFALTGLLQIYVGAGFVPGSGTILWTTDLDSPVGVPALMGNPLPGLFQIPIPLGGLMGPGISVAGFAAPWRFDKPFILKPQTDLRSKVTTVSTVSTGDPNFCVSIFEGFTWPA